MSDPTKHEHPQGEWSNNDPDDPEMSESASDRNPEDSGSYTDKDQ